MTGIPHNQQYPNGYPLPQYPQLQQQQAYGQAQYNTPGVSATQQQNAYYSALNTAAQAQYGALPQAQSYNSYPPTAQGWPSAVPQPRDAPLVMGPPIRMGFDSSHPPDSPRPFSTHESPNPFPGNNKRKREPPMRGSRGTHQSYNPSFPSQRPQHHGKPDKARAKVAPQVPNFGFALSPPQGVQAPSVDATDKPKKKKRRKHNQLGLTPKGEEHENSEDGIDEEAAFASGGGA